jgi:hypothetical protein
MNYTLTLTEQEVQVLGAALAELPFKVSSALITKIQSQINDQITDSVTEENPTHSEEIIEE